MDLGEALVPFPLAFENEDFSAFLGKLSACARGEGIPEGFVPHSTYWLVRDGSEVIGVSNLRHRLTKALRFEGGHIGYGVRPTARRCRCDVASKKLGSHALNVVVLARQDQVRVRKA